MEEGLSDVHSGDDKSQSEKKIKRTVKTPAQVEALEKFYNEHKYPTESMKSQLAESIGLSEKQVSGWFCHRRLKDKRLLNGEFTAHGRQDRSSGVVQDRGSGYRQDSCGSTKQGDDRNYDTREVESGRLPVREFSIPDLANERGSHYNRNYNHLQDASSGSSSSLRDTSSNQDGDPFDVATSHYPTPRFPVDARGVKARSGPSGYLKLKGQVENSAITAVKRQLGRNYREDGPPLGVEFDPLPPGAFESSTQDPIDEPHYSGEPAVLASNDISKSCKLPNFGKGNEYSPNMVSHNEDVDRVSFRMPSGSDIPENHMRQKFRPKARQFDHHDYYHGRNSSADFAKGSESDIHGESRDGYQKKSRHGLEVMRMDSNASQPHILPLSRKVREEQAEPWFPKYNDSGMMVPRGESIEHKSSRLPMKGKEYHQYNERGLSRSIKEGKSYGGKRISNENGDPVHYKVPLQNEAGATKRMKTGFVQQQRMKTSALDDQPWAYQVTRPAADVPSSFSEDDGSAETSTSVE